MIIHTVRTIRITEINSFARTHLFCVTALVIFFKRIGECMVSFIEDIASVLEESAV